MAEKVPRLEVERLLTQWSWGKGTKAAYYWFRPHGERRFWAKFVWKDLIPPKFSFISWLALRGRLTTRDRVTWTTTEKRCEFCKTQDESIEHLFFNCSETKKLWEDICSWSGMQRRSTTIKSAIKWIARHKTGSAIIQKARRIALMTSVYFIWKARNALINDGWKFDAVRTTSSSLPPIVCSTLDILMNKSYNTYRSREVRISLKAWVPLPSVRILDSLLVLLTWVLFFLLGSFFLRVFGLKRF